MAIRTIILRKKITDQKKILDDLMKKRSGFDQIRAELEKREAEIVASVDEASTDEERSAVEEAADQYDSDKKAFDDDVQATENQISDIETEVAEIFLVLQSHLETSAVVLVVVQVREERRLRIIHFEVARQLVGSGDDATVHLAHEERCVERQGALQHFGMQAGREFLTLDEGEVGVSTSL